MPDPELPAPRRRVSIVVPCFNEGAGLDAFFARLQATLATLPGCEFELLCVDDGSDDDTLEVLRRHAATDARLAVLELSRNFG
ncbi:MAG: glycosyltransferase, partial [Chitinophagaceae bacterium]|nr:glycosyltransferase [Rubrivivax sp.]